MRAPAAAALLATLALGAWAQEAPKEQTPKPKELATYYQGRAFPGSPSSYAHKDEGDYDAEPDACLSCHRRGTDGAPVTPHPAVPECRHCHLRAKAVGTFRETTFAPAPAPQRLARALPGAPPPMVHPPSALRVGCLACHGPKATVKALKTEHPERADCQQCHVSRRSTEAFSSALR